LSPENRHLAQINQGQAATQSISNLIAPQAFEVVQIGDLKEEIFGPVLHIGNVYINRNQIGAVVGVQPFGGEGLSGTGPKAGGPHYLYRFCAEQTVTINTTAAGGMRRCWRGEERGAVQALSGTACLICASTARIRWLAATVPKAVSFIRWTKRTRAIVQQSAAQTQHPATSG
jgi:hypothetical protein